ncbi:MAG: glutamate--tRNA ligase [Clostridiales Family XIII bacterium]|jgi:glutamyl-tRNA synthetase|nr:glutamate--tRNA ligase [Clostridiales Family XIII bacterium]
MNSPKDFLQLTELLFPELDGSKSGGDPTYFESIFPERSLPENAFVTRLGPSPTGFIHLGNLYMTFINEKLAKQTNGICLLRIEDTDRKREVEGAVESLISQLVYFGVNFAEGVMYDEKTNAISEKGNYGPYYQSAREEIYKTFVKQLVLTGKAYPCFLTEEEISAIRETQEQEKLTPGIYGKWAKYRDRTVAEYETLLSEKKPYVIRFRADAPDGSQMEAMDGIRGKLTMPKNEMDVVILKSDGLPTYHFAHVVDDHFMRTTHVIRGEEWLSSLPIHVALFEALAWKLPIYCHTTVLMKMDGDKKRKLSKRKDPELSLSYYRQEGYHPQAILEYLLTIINSNFEEWRMENPDATIDNFQMTSEKMGTSGILFDLEKLQDVSKDVLLSIPASDLATFLLDWARLFDEEAYKVFSADKRKLEQILDIGRTGDKPRKDLAYAKQIRDFISYFYDEFFVIEDAWPENATNDVSLLLKDYLESFNLADDRDVWFDKIREISIKNGYAAKPKDFKKNPDAFKGHVGDVSSVIRIALVGRASSPDLYEIQQILGEEITKTRIERSIT